MIRIAELSSVFLRLSKPNIRISFFNIEVANMATILALMFVLISMTTAAPIAKRFVDMTYPYDDKFQNYLGFSWKSFNLTVVSNGTWDNGLWVQAEEFTSGTHVGTHMDAPSHTTLGGINVDKIPVSRLIAPAAVIDITQKGEQNADAGVTIEDLTEWERITGQSLNEKIVLLRTGWGRYWDNNTAYMGTSDNDVTKLLFPGLEASAAQWLVDNRNIYGVGSDALSYDKGSARDFICHKILLGHGIYGLESVANLDQIPIYGATLHVMPMKLKDASGAPTRIVATYPDVYFTASARN